MKPLLCAGLFILAAILYTWHHIPLNPTRSVISSRRRKPVKNKGYVANWWSMYIVRERRRWYSTELIGHFSRALFLIVLSHLVVDFGQWIPSRQQEHLHHWGWLRMIGAVATKADPWEFRDNGMFDPRRDIYWSNVSSISGSIDSECQSFLCDWQYTKNRRTLVARRGTPRLLPCNIS